MSEPSEAGKPGEPGETYSEAEIGAAVASLNGPDALRQAELLVARAAPQLQLILAQALESGGWFGESHEAEVRRVSEIDDDDERATALRTMLAEESRMAMMVGVAVGWAMAQRLDEIKANEETEST